MIADDDLPPYLRDAERDKRAPAVELPIEPPPESLPPAEQQPQEQDELGVDPFLRRS